MYVLEENDYLEHYGVKGQKWGVRKQKRTGETKSSNRLNRAKTFVKKAAGNKKVQTFVKVAGTVSTAVAVAALLGTPAAALGVTAVRSAITSIGSLGLNSALDRAKTREDSTSTWKDAPIIKELEITPLTIRDINGKVVR